ncbi:hypothetical protein PHOBOS_70 [Erwinia phage vB_EamM_Phobos]|uniref:hypothetical protein n=1 Tax=Erwinia phage vB_EamM_Phobos TaxID=1883377 RepID=UPI00081C7B5A|nr:hypothetical protein BIZ79_gp070 [Erwinia phage vB_EamM_Phobos]ANZ50260.1 hypothetical protein PHOBOS_70 [Erwinia phage vB_EamM_Phobos]
MTTINLKPSTISTEVKAFVRNHPVALLCLTNFIYSGRDLKDLTVEELQTVHEDALAKAAQFNVEVPSADEPQEVLNEYYNNVIAQTIMSEEVSVPFEADTIVGMIDELVERVKSHPRTGTYYAILEKSDPNQARFFDDMKALVLE